MTCCRKNHNVVLQCVVRAQRRECREAECERCENAKRRTGQAERSRAKQSEAKQCENRPFKYGPFVHSQSRRAFLSRPLSMAQCNAMWSNASAEAA